MSLTIFCGIKIIQMLMTFFKGLIFFKEKNKWDIYHPSSYKFSLLKIYKFYWSDLCISAADENNQFKYF